MPEEVNNLVGSDGLEWPQTFDAQIWAKEFIKRSSKDSDIAIDEGCMISWFANAIMVGYDKSKRGESQPVLPMLIVNS